MLRVVDPSRISWVAWVAAVSLVTPSWPETLILRVVFTATVTVIPVMSVTVDPIDPWFSDDDSTHPIHPPGNELSSEARWVVLVAVPGNAVRLANQIPPRVRGRRCPGPLPRGRTRRRGRWGGWWSRRCKSRTARR